tara:strand:- start:159 stop:842 length:684 start_codon:yes stop_codon:yes gene_type:complete
MGQLTMSISKRQSNTVFVIKPLSNIENLTPKTDNFNNIVFKVNAKMVRGTLQSKDKKYSVEPGSSFEWQISNALYNSMNAQDLRGTPRIGVEMHVTPDSTNWVVCDMDNDSALPWDNKEGVTEQDVNKTDDTSQINANNSLTYGYRDVKSRDNQRSLEIKWGMSLNNAVKIICESKDSKFFEDMEQVQVEVRNMTHRIMNVATGLDIWLKEEQGDKSFKHSIDDERF